jgi:hypothetical protein
MYNNPLDVFDDDNNIILSYIIFYYLYTVKTIVIDFIFQHSYPLSSSHKLCCEIIIRVKMIYLVHSYENHKNNKIYIVWWFKKCIRALKT